MPYSQSSSNIRKIRSSYREGKFILFSRTVSDSSSPSEVSISGTSNIVIDANVISAGLVVSSIAMDTPKDNTGREAKISISADPAYLQVYIEPEDNADRFVMIKKVNVTMPTFTLDANGKPI
jgi:hypothetical protein